MTEAPLLSAQGVELLYGENKGCQQVDLQVYPGEVLGIVGESGSGKSTLLRGLAGLEPFNKGQYWYQQGDQRVALHHLPESDKRALKRTKWGLIHQNPRDGLHLNLSAGANIAEPLMALGKRHYGDIREQAKLWMERVELDVNRIDDAPQLFSGGMQQRLQIARNLVTHPKLVFMDEPTGGLDVSVQARILDLVRQLVHEMNVSVILVTHDMGVARLLADRLMVMRQSKVVETGLTDQILDDPQHAYTQLLVSSILRV